MSGVYFVGLWICTLPVLRRFTVRMLKTLKNEN